MRVSKSGIAGGIIFILIGLLMAARAFGFDYDIFFDGWWTLFIIVPCLIGLFERGNRTPFVFGLIIGLFLLLSAQGYLHFWMARRLFVALIFVFIGVAILFRGKGRSGRYYSENYSESYRGSDSNGNESYKNTDEDRTGSYQTNEGYNNSSRTESYQNYNDNAGRREQNGYHTDNRGQKSFTTFLNGRTVEFVNETFDGAYISAVLGNFTLDIRDAKITENIIIDISTVIGGVDIYVPHGVKVVVNANPILSSVDNRTAGSSAPDAITIFINGNCILGGVVIK